MKNNRRYDLSSKLTHFFRKLDMDDGSAPHLPEYWGDQNIIENTVASALFLLRCAIRHGLLWATWSKRGNIRTIYGPHPAVCFTEMPTAAFLEASAAREKAKQKMSTYALTFPKPKMFALGARPVIYGLSGPTAGIPNGDGGGPRIMPEGLLPLREQYRYVTYAPTGGRWQVDWTHEREWRWCFADGDALSKFESAIEEYGVVSEVKDFLGLRLYDGSLEGIGVIVNTKQEAEMILHDVLTLVDLGMITPNTFEYVLVADDIPSPETIRSPDEETNAIAAATIDLSEILTPSPKRDENFARQVRGLVEKVEAEAGEPEVGEPGGCWLWLIDNVHQVTRALLNTGNLVINHDGKYLLRLDEFFDDRSLRQREGMTMKLAALLNTTFGIESGYFSVLASGDPNALPSYNSDFLDNQLHYNFGHHGLND